MPDLHELHRHARAIFSHALSAVDPRPAIRNPISQGEISTPSIYSVAIGKAAVSMALGLDDALGDKLSAGVIVSTSFHHSTRWQSFTGGHPLPNEASLAAARAAFALLDRANDEQATIIFLISGGGTISRTQRFLLFLRTTQRSDRHRSHRHERPRSQDRAEIIRLKLDSRRSKPYKIRTGVQPCLHQSTPKLQFPPNRPAAAH